MKLSTGKLARQNRQCALNYGSNISENIEDNKTQNIQNNKNDSKKESCGQ